MRRTDGAPELGLGLVCSLLAGAFAFVGLTVLTSSGGDTVFRPLASFLPFAAAGMLGLLAFAGFQAVEPGRRTRNLALACTALGLVPYALVAGPTACALNFAFLLAGGGNAFNTLRRRK